MKRFTRAAVLLISCAMLLAACGKASFQEENAKAVVAAKTVFNENRKKPNNKTKDIDFYLPFGYEIKRNSPNNILLKNGSKTYILFYNPNEAMDSDVVYKASVAQYEKLETNKQFKGKGKLGFLLVERLDGGMNTLTVGVGGVKITTEMKTADLDDEAKAMMQIANSAKIKK
ncbi:hypothetical protein DRW41_14130 [Neobacillus piezotolerans]|uniref:DUF4367 domain-containing protein n=1 Tax=Neobacillus piezotolerans TaxID=2259171 RepID=A0A3D8GPB9_9BACI|nr:hypothetical protein [Neobacillus piezotolerans]RDU36167.1 hypothetical protein DRW41_14130 [Neobacillus piezotolerans]